MARRERRPARQSTAVPADGRLLSIDLDGWAGGVIAHAGRELALLGKVVSLRLADRGTVLEARVRDRGPTPYEVTVAARAAGVNARCACSYDEGPACKHAVAALEALRFPRPIAIQTAATQGRVRRAGRLARGQGRIVTHSPVQAGTLLSAPGEWTLTRDERIALAREEETAARKQRAKKERPSVKKLAMRGGPPRFRVAGRDPEAPYTVTLRGRDWKAAGCTCPDFAKNELGTCKHIERVRNWFARQRKRLPPDMTSVWWRPREWPASVPRPLQEIRVDAPPSAIDSRVRERFDDDGWILPAPEGVAPRAWVTESVAVAREAASTAGVAFDLDPAVDRRLDEAEAAERTEAMLAAAEVGGAIWNDIVPGLGFQLHPYQEVGSVLLARRGRAFLADDMGLGKTLQAIVAALLLRRTAAARKGLVVCPASLKHQWQQEIAKACGERAVVVEGGRTARLATYRRWRQGFLVLNYELVLRDLEAVRAAKPDLVVLDEAQRIKNWDTKTAKAVKRLTSRFAFVLTGTPLENRLTELHSLVEFLNTRALGPRWRLLPTHAVPGPTGRVAAYEELDILRARLAGFFLRRERDEVLDQLPPRTDNTFWTELTAAQWRPYRRHARKVAALISRNRPLTAAEVRLLLQSLTSMRILCNAWAQYDWEATEARLRARAAEDLRWLGSPKLEEFVNVLDDLLEEEGTKVVVFSQWERLLRLALHVADPRLGRRGERGAIFHGGLDTRARARLLDEFRSDPGFRVLFSTDSGGLGLNLQEAASIVVNLEVPWNPAVLEQRIGRVHRLGQRQSVRVLHFVTRGAIEERVRQIVENKRALFEGLLVDEADRVELDAVSQATFVDRMRALLVG